MPSKRPDKASLRRIHRTTFSDELRDLIDRDGRSPHAIAKASDVSAACLSRFLAEKRGLTSETIDRLTAELGLHLGAPTRAKGRPRRESASSVSTVSTEKTENTDETDEDHLY